MRSVTKALEHALDGRHDVAGLAVQPRASLAGLLIDVPAELGGDHDLVAERGNTFAQDSFDLMWAIGLAAS